MIKTFRARSYGCLKDVAAKLTPLHAFIGPNDSGKSTLLGAVGALTSRASPAVDSLKVGPFERDTILEAVIEGGLGYGLSVGSEPGGPAGEKLVERAWAGEEVLATEDRGDTRGRGMLGRHREEPRLSELENALQPARMLRLDPDALREGSEIIPSGVRVDFLNEHGLGLPGVYDAVLNRDFEAFGKILADVRRLFPSVKKLGLANVGGARKALEITLAGDKLVGPEHMSEGLLYYLAFAALQFLAPVSVILVEEPENGLHPARIVDVMRVLREVSRTTQVLLATHSPLVVNEMEPSEVSVVTRTEAEGTKLTLMKDTTSFAKRSSVYALGELWLSFADGEAEARLVPDHGAS